MIARLAVVAVSAVTCAAVGATFAKNRLPRSAVSFSIAAAGGVERLAAIAVDEAIALIAHHDGGEADEQRRHQHQHEQRRDHGDAAFVGAAHRDAFASPCRLLRRRSDRRSPGCARPPTSRCDCGRSPAPASTSTSDRTPTWMLTFRIWFEL